ncbi:MAG: DUF177 domain-containing protein [Deltaproteobacteria bacterium]|jgi:uncharacterized protein|nr:DUF177 domain-containing protein [Deltaproteobacteria bacterium]
MDILIYDIPDEGLKIDAGSGDDWLSGVLIDVLGGLVDKNSVSAQLNIMRYDDNIDLQGLVQYNTKSTCDRCLAKFDSHSNVDIHTVLIPVSDGRERLSAGEIEEIELSSEDLEFGYYEGDRFDLADVVREQVLLARPMKHLCKHDCKGLCQKCGKNLNEEICGCEEESTDPRWASLKGIKVTKN